VRGYHREELRAQLLTDIGVSVTGS
jgi:hypothetical protein